MAISMKNFLNGWGFLTGIPLLILILYLSKLIHDISKLEHHCCEWMGVAVVALCGTVFLLISSILYLESYLLSDLLILNKQRQIFLFYVTSILYWGLNWTFTFVVPMTDFFHGQLLRFIQGHFGLSFVLSCFFEWFVWWVLSVCLAIIISRFTSDGFLQKTNRIFSKIGRCLCWIVVLVSCAVLAFYLLGYLLNRDKPEI